MTPRLVLASGSPRRRALLSALGVEFDVVTSGAEEIFDGPSPECIVIENARRKRDDAQARINEAAIVVAADTLVYLDRRPLGKPRDLGEAAEMLEALSGRTHTVVTGLALSDTRNGASAEGFSATDVTFRDLSPEEIAGFVEAVKPLDRAGAYTVDGPGSLLVSGYRGCYMNVLGLPITTLDDLLRELGVRLFERIRPDRAVFL